LTHSAANGVYGENLSTYYVSPKPAKFPYNTMDYHVINGWYSEEPNWNCTTNVCTTTGGKQCGHLTQMVWCATTSVGCGIAQCQLTSGGTNWFVQNCVGRYKSAGNYVGQNPLGTLKCPKQPTTLGPYAPSPVAPVPPPVAPVAPVAPVKAPVSPVAPTKTPASPVAPTKTPASPVAPTKTPASPVAPTSVPVASPVAPTTSSVWWSQCIANYWPTDSTGKQYQKLTPCAWEPWVDTSATPQTWCCPNPANEWDYCWPVYNLGAAGDKTAACPAGVAPVSSIQSEETAHAGDLPMGAWIGIGVGIAVAIIIIIVVVIIVQKKKNDERV